jgi:hypothetical protein
MLAILGCGGTGVSGTWTSVGSSPPYTLRIDGGKFQLTAYQKGSRQEISGTWRTTDAEGSHLLELTTTQPSPLLGNQSSAVIEYVVKDRTLTLPNGFHHEGEVVLRKALPR